ncbi:MAG: hypothetical protein MUE44_22245 [Oscillatoriaceae cyanobacterium Prado104]|jgi:hypothetical protein|nr:hypothetical protein [Oscillatoriaceae cyanobacterium Prado104]
MTIKNDCPAGRSQFLTQPDTRKYVLGWLGLGSYAQHPIIPANLPQPEFFIGSKVADHWVDEFGANCIEYGEIVGVCWQINKQEWGYFVNWYKGAGPDWLYPCFDGSLVVSGVLRSANND